MEESKKIIFWDKCILLIMIAIIFNGRNIFSYAKIPVMILFIGIPILRMCITQNTKLLFRNINKMWIGICLYLLIGVSYSYNIKSTLIYFIPIAIGVVFLLFKINKNIFYKLMDIVLIGSIIFALSNVISVLIPNFIPRFCSFFVKITDNIYIELAGNNFSGLAGEKAVSAFILNIGIGIIYSKIIVNGKFTKGQIVQLLILFSGIFLTGKRTLTAVPLLLLFMIYIVSGEKNKILKMIKIGSLILIGIIILVIVFPSLFHVIERFLTTDSNGREELWDNCIIMFKNSPILGQGFGTFNDYNRDLGYRQYGRVWTFEAHNIYYQLLGETGIIGLIVVVLAFLYALIKTIILLRKDLIDEDKKLKGLLYVSLYIQLLFIIYGFTGNTMYYWNQFFVYMIAVSILNVVEFQTNFSIRKGIIKDEKKYEKII